MRRKRKIMFLGALVCAVALASAPAHGALVIIGIEAVVHGVSDSYGNFLEGRVNIGDLITGTYTYDTDTPDSSSSPNVGRYQHYAYPCGISLSVGTLDFMTDPADTSFEVEIGDNASYDDSYIVDSLINLPLPNGTSVSRIRFVLIDHSENAIASIELPATPPSLSHWQVNYLNIEGGPDRTGFVVQGHVTSAAVIPEPATIVLLGLGGLLLRPRSRK